MRSVQFGGDGYDLERFARDVLQRRLEVTQLNPYERRMSWSVPGSSGVSSAAKHR